MIDKELIIKVLHTIDHDFLKSVSMEGKTVRWKGFPNFVISKESFSKMIGVCRFKAIFVFNIVSSISLLLSNKIPFSIDNCLDYLNLILANSNIFQILQLPLTSGFLKEIIITSLVFSKSSTLKKDTDLFLERVGSLLVFDLNLFQEMVTTTVKTSKGGYRMEMTMIGRLLMVKEKYRYDLYIHRFHNKSDLNTVFIRTSDEIRRLCSGAKIKSICDKLNETRVYSMENLFSNYLQLFNRSTRSKMILNTLSVEIVDKMLTITLPDKYKDIIYDYDVVFIPSICSYISKDGPFKFSALGFYKSPSKQSFVVTLNKNLIFDVVEINKLNIVYI